MSGGQWDSIKEKIATAVKANLKVEEGEFVNPWSNQDKASVLQQTRCFGDTPIDALKCLELCTRVLYLLQQGEKLSSDELTTLFFGCTKLFQAPNMRLRRMVYLVIKELEASESEVFIITSSLIKDMNSKTDCFRANSIRVLSRILDPAMAAQIDRYLKTAIVDRNPFVASSALVCGIALIRTAPDVVKRWVSEVQETVNSQHAMVQFHALALMYELKKTDRLALHKVIMSLAKTSSKGPMAECMLIRYATATLLGERDSTVEKTLLQYLDSCLRHKSEMVTYEAARAFCTCAIADKEGSGSMVFNYDITHATTVLQIFLTSPKPVIRFGAIRTLNMLAQQRPQVAARCNCDMEPLLTDSNRNIATLALTTLLKTGHESNVERLVKQITSFMSEISDAFKVEVVRAVKGLCLLYPSKHKVLMTFLSSNLREDGTMEFKKDLVDALILCIGQVPAARENGLLHLCEYIEDCEFPSLCSKVLAFLGEEVPQTSQPPKFIRFIYNRLILENAVVRAAAVDALAKIAVKCTILRRDILLLLRFGENDHDDEVRDRIALYTSVLDTSLKEEKVADGFAELVTAELPFSVDAMYDSMLQHITSDTKDTAFSFAGLPSEDAYKATLRAQAALTEKKPGAPGAPSHSFAPAAKAATGGPAAAAAAAAESKANANAELTKVLAEILPGVDMGPLQHSCKPKALTESEAEYTVQCIKHMYKDFVVLEMYCGNTVPGITLENVEARLSGVSGDWSEVGATAIDKLENGQTASAHVVLQKVSAAAAGATTGKFGVALHFMCKEEGDDVGYDDDYPVEKLSITVGDYMYGRALPPGQFKSVWEQMSAQGQQAEEKISLSFKSLEPAVEYLINTLNMEPCDKTQTIDPDKNGHQLLVSGTFLGGNTAIVKALVGFSQQAGTVVCRVTARSKSAEVCQVLVQAATQ